MTESQTYDAVIVGSGAGAAPIAFRLAQAGVSVLVLEKGEPFPRDETVEDELAQLHLEMHRPSASDDPTIVKSQGQLVAPASRVGQAFYLIGGGTVRYAATSWRFRPQDFRKRSLYGAIPGTSLVDWPLTYADLEPYYTQAELEIGISGVPGIDPTEPFRSRNVLLPPLKSDRFSQRLTKAAASLGWKPFPIPLAIHSQPSPRTGAAACMQCGWCSGYPCLFQAKSSVDTVIYPRAAKTGHFTLRTSAYATRITLDDRARVKGVEYLDLSDGSTRFVACRVLILAASAIQTARLLLLSAGGPFPDGLANSSGLVGHHLMFHIEAKAGAVFDEEYHQGLYKKVAVHDFYFPDRDAGFINHCSLQSGSKAAPISFALSRPGFGADFVRDLRQDFLKTHELQCMIEDLPQEGNHVTLSPDRKDPWGLPAPEVHHAYHAQDKLAATRALSRLEQWLKAAGGKDIRLPKIHDNITGRYTWHLMGTARMGTDPAQSVVNPSCQTHDVPNLFIGDGSPFCTSAGINPTLTIQALSFRTADRILALMKAGQV